MGAWALLWPLLLLLLIELLGQLPGAQAQACTVSENFFEVEENTNLTEPLVNISTPEGYQVTLGSSSTPFAFLILRNQLFLNVIPDYEENSILQAELECKRGETLVTQLRVFVSVLDVNDNPPVFPFTTKEKAVEEDTKVNSTVIPEEELEAEDRDKDDILFYTLQEVTPGIRDFFSLVGANRPTLRLDQRLDFYKWPSVTFLLLVRDTREENAEPSHTATATVLLEVLPADLRPPWFLPCSYSDDHVCIEAQYHGAVPTGQQLLHPLILRPGPVYAVDGDRGINQRILYSILTGNVNNTFDIGADTGNLTMKSSVPSPMTFLLVVKGEQADFARYSVTQVTVEARAANGSLPHFPQSLYHGTVGLGSGAGVAVKDADDPSQPLRIQAQDPEFPDLNSAITYHVTNHSYFWMSGETMLTATTLTRAEVFYAEVEAKNTVTSGTATTVVEIQISEQEAPSTGPPTSPEAGGATGPTRSTISEAPRPPGPSQGPSMTASGGGTGPHPPSGTTLRTPALPTPGGPPSSGNSTSPPPATPGGGSAQTQKPGTSQPMLPGSSRSPPPSGSTPPLFLERLLTQDAGGKWAMVSLAGMPAEGLAQDRRFSVVDMALLGGVLGALLLLAIAGLTVLVHEHYCHQLGCCSRKAPLVRPSAGRANEAFQTHDEANWAPAPSPEPGPESTEAPPAPAQPPPPTRALGPPAAAQAGDSPAAVRSILTKERRPEGGYKAVWFGENIGAEADVVVLNAPTRHADGASDPGGEGSGDKDSGQGGGPHEVPGARARDYI
ncbi:cadherin-related family member 5 [Cynocephalus volans]|uniref:cadherin-related family member 5 n=1 Tax=Cynocephalus volans TaxID=110931 RepID=UPI002FCC2000